jgi:hypothetical protein
LPCSLYARTRCVTIGRAVDVYIAALWSSDASSAVNARS